MTDYDILKQKLIGLTHLRSALAVLQWDQEVMMPKQGTALRPQTVAHLSGILHEAFVALDTDGLLTRLHDALQAGKLDDQTSIVVREVWREYEREVKLPKEFVQEVAQTVGEAHAIWVEARSKSDFAHFALQLEKIVALKRQEADYLGFTESPYDPLLDTYEPGMTTAEIAPILEELKLFLIDFLQQIKTSGVDTHPERLAGTFPLAKQRKLAETIAQKIGYNFAAGRLDVSAHPFSISFSPEDVRITTRFDEHNLFDSLLSTVHEVGHALYEQGLPVEHFGTALGEFVSLGIHESQSRVWENQIGKSQVFWHHFYPLLQKTFPKPFATLRVNDFYCALNTVRPSLIRTESDEVTYNLHIIIRFEIEKALIEGTLEVKDIPTVWNAKYKEYLGIDVPDDAKGALQDIHWAHGSFGYFPTYTLGNLYAAQFFATAQKELLYLDDEIAKGEFAPFLKWLHDHIHAHGKTFTASQLVQEVTDEPLASHYFTDYLKNKFSAIYSLKQ